MHHLLSGHHPYRHGGYHIYIPVKDIIIHTAVERVLTTAIEDIGTRIAVERIVIGAAFENVITLATAEDIGTRFTIERICATITPLGYRSPPLP